MIKRNERQIFDDLAALSDLELAKRYQFVWYRINELEEDTDELMDEEMMLFDVICTRFCNMVGVPVNLLHSDTEQSLFFDWRSDIVISL